MAKKFVVSLDLNKNELINARIQNLSSAPASPVAGQIYYNTTDGVVKFYNGTSWINATGIGEIVLPDTGVTPGSYGSSTAIPTFTVDAKGRLTAAGTATVATQLDLGADNAHGGYKLDLATDTVKFVGGEGIDTNYSTDNTTHTITISGEDASDNNKGIASFNSTDFSVSSGHVSLAKDPVITLSGDVTGSATMSNLGDVTISTSIAANSVALGTDTTGNYVAAITGTSNEIEVSGSGSENATVTIGLPDDVTITNNLTVGGNLTVNGTVTAVNTETTTLNDNIIVLNNNETGVPSQNAGIEVERGSSNNVSILWNETSDQWTISNDGSHYFPITRKYTATIGDGANSSYVLTHDLGTHDCTVQVRDASNNQVVEVDIELTSTNTTTISFASAPAANAYKVVIVG